MSALTFESPAKINLFLAITGRRADGFHDLVSLVAPLAWGDTLTVELADEFSLVCDDPAVPLDANNLVLKAAAAFRQATGWSLGAKFSLVKRIPMGSGLGGGSCNAAMALRALNQLAGNVLDLDQLSDVAAKVGSDCPLFLHDGPVVMRGRGDVITPVPPKAAGRIGGRPVLLFKPAFGISTPWAYRQLAERAPSGYVAAEEIEAKLAAWLAGESPVDDLLFNNMEGPAFWKFPALPVLLDRLREDFGVIGRMSGSGSACFALVSDAASMDAMVGLIRSSWGESALVVRTRLR
ncbi:MAG TPA: 4-(cytidine 5'-diphospho)-2-C-methyl-D-erythritol kinase [Opitutus sp.]|nr:4-(cytidine 5'-diphospho)-2-C-methyl-D-erythritol kinase [Opitutus sp.]